MLLENMLGFYSTINILPVRVYTINFISYNDHDLSPSALKGARLEHIGKLPNNPFFFYKKLIIISLLLNFLNYPVCVSVCPLASSIS